MSPYRRRKRPPQHRNRYPASSRVSNATFCADNCHANAFDASFDDDADCDAGCDDATIGVCCRFYSIDRLLSVLAAALLLSFEHSQVALSNSLSIP